MIQTKLENRIYWIQLNRPERRNALSPELISDLKQEIQKGYEDQRVKVLVLIGKGNAFCSGADLEFIQNMQDFSYEENLEDSNNLKELFYLIYSGPKPVVGAINGHAIAGGAGLASVCDFSISAKVAKFGFTEVKIGFIPALVSVFLIRKIGEGRARDILLSGRIFDAEEAKNLGLITEVVDSAELEKKVNEFCLDLITQNSSESMKATKNLLSQLQEKTLDAGLDFAAMENAHSRATEDCKEGIEAFLEKRKPKW